MKAIATKPGKKNSLLLKQIKEPRPNDDEVLIETLEIGLDGTDKELIQGDYGQSPENDDYLINGHECLGRVEKVGKKADTTLKEGDLVVPTVRRPDDCYNCRNGETDNCLKGNYTERGIKGKHGYLRKYFTEKPSYLIKIPEYLRDIAVMLEPLSIGQKAIRMAYKTQERLLWKPEKALIVGTGSIGLLMAITLREKGLDVTVADRSQAEGRKNNIYKKTGITHYNTKKTSLEEIASEEGKPDLAIDATGSSYVALKTMTITKTNGVAILTSITGGENKIEIDAAEMNQDLVLNNKAVVGVVNSNPKDFRSGISCMEAINKRWNGLLPQLITARYTLDETDKALTNLGNNIKTVIDINQ